MVNDPHTNIYIMTAYISLESLTAPGNINIYICTSVTSMCSHDIHICMSYVYH